MKISTTEKGYSLIEFKGMYDSECSLEEKEKTILFGVKDGDMMHLNQEQVASLLPYLENFAKTSELVDRNLPASKNKETYLSHDDLWLKGYSKICNPTSRYKQDLKNKVQKTITNERKEELTFDILENEFFIDSLSLATASLAGELYVKLDNTIILEKDLDVIKENKDKYLNNEIEYNILDSLSNASFVKNKCYIKYKNKLYSESKSIKSISLVKINESFLVFKIQIPLYSTDSDNAAIELDSMFLDAESFSISLNYPEIQEEDIELYKSIVEKLAKLLHIPTEMLLNIQKDKTNGK